MQEMTNEKTTTRDSGTVGKSDYGYVSDTQAHISISLAKMSKIVNVVEATFVVITNAIETLPRSEGVSDGAGAQTSFLISQSISLLSAIQSNSLSLLQHYHSGQVDKSITDIEHITSLITIAKRTNTLSEMNADLLLQGYAYVLEACHIYNQERRLVTPTLSSLTNEDKETYPAHKVAVESLNFLYKETEQGKDIDASVKAPVRETYTPEYQTKKDDIGDARVSVKDRVQNEVKKTETTVNKNAASSMDRVTEKLDKADKDNDRQSNRRQEILNILSSTPISIKDIAMHIAGCSEKTIQRELNLLLDQRKIKKIGEKRWSKYMLR